MHDLRSLLHGRHTRRPARLTTAFALVPALALAVAGCGGPSAASRAPTVTVAAFGTDESAVLANLYADALREAGQPARVRQLTTRDVVLSALRGGDVDVVPEYAASLTDFLNRSANGPDAASAVSPDLDRTLAALHPLAEAAGLTLATPSSATDQSGFAVTERFATDNHLRTLSDLAGLGGPLVLGGPPDCDRRPDCLPGLEATYGASVTGFRPLDDGGALTRATLVHGQVQIGFVVGSNTGLAVDDLRLLDDDRHVQPSENVLPVVRSGRSSPALLAALDRVSAALTTADLVSMDARVAGRADAATVAREFARERGLLR